MQVTFPWPPPGPYLDAAFALAKQAGTPLLGDGEIELTVRFFPPTKARRDLDNLFASFKPALDGIALAWGVDDKRFVFNLRRGTTFKPGAVLVTVEGV